MESYLSKRPPQLSSGNIPGYRMAPGTGTWTRYTAYDAPKQYLYKRGFTSTVTPNFETLKRFNNLPVNNFYAYTGIITDDMLEVFESPSWKPNPATRWGYRGIGRMVGGWSHLATQACYANFATSDAGNQSARRAEQKALKVMSNMKFNAAQAFAERRQAADMLIKSVNRFITFAIAFKRGRWSAINKAFKARNYPLIHVVDRKRMDETFGPLVKNPELGDLLRSPNRKTFPNLWLEYSYGWIPLLNDIHGAAQLLAEKHSDSRPHRVSTKDTTSQTFNGVYSSDGVTATALAQVDIRSKCVLEFDVSNSLLDSMKSTGISNPALLAWELLPYSFVVDWFIPVGNYLEKINADSGLTFIKGSTSTLTKYQSIARAGSNGTFYLVSGTAMKLDFIQLYRSKLTSFPSAQMPSLNLGLNLSQVTSGLSLLAQLFDRK